MKSKSKKSKGFASLIRGIDLSKMHSSVDTSSSEFNWQDKPLNSLTLEQKMGLEQVAPSIIYAIATRDSEMFFAGILALCSFEFDSVQVAERIQYLTSILGVMIQNTADTEWRNRYQNIMDWTGSELFKCLSYLRKNEINSL